MKNLVKNCLLTGLLIISIPLLTNMTTYLAAKSQLSSKDPCKTARSIQDDVDTLPPVAKFLAYGAKLAANNYLRDNSDCGD